MFIANSLWPHQDYPLAPDYVKFIKTNYFKGDWASPFKKTDTADMLFQMTPDQVINTPMMYQHKTFAYYADEDVQELEMPYAGNRLSIVLLLPKRIDGLTDMEKGIGAAKLKQWISGLSQTTMEVWIPRFRITAESQLAEKLQALGMVDAFGDKADFAGMSETKELCLSVVLHKAFVEVNEAGTEAAAVTAAVGIPAGLAEFSEHPLFLTNHPFLFLIRDRKSGVILFMGRVVNPAG